MSFFYVLLVTFWSLSLLTQSSYSSRLCFQRWILILILCSEPFLRYRNLCLCVFIVFQVLSISSGIYRYQKRRGKKTEIQYPLTSEESITVVTRSWYQYLKKNCSNTIVRKYKNIKNFKKTIITSFLDDISMPTHGILTLIFE